MRKNRENGKKIRKDSEKKMQNSLRKIQSKNVV